MIQLTKGVGKPERIWLWEHWEHWDPLLLFSVLLSGDRVSLNLELAISQPGLSDLSCLEPSLGWICRR